MVDRILLKKLKKRYGDLKIEAMLSTAIDKVLCDRIERIDEYLERL